MWISPFRDVAKEINDQAIVKLVAKGNEAYRCIAHHKSTLGEPTVEDIEQYFKYSDVQEYGATCLDIAIGSRVRCTHNLATELGMQPEVFY